MLHKGRLLLTTICVLFFAAPIWAQQTDSLRYDVDDPLDPFAENYSNLDLNLPASMSRDLEYDPETGEYKIVTKIGDEVIDSSVLTPEEYFEYIDQKNTDAYWERRFDYDNQLARDGEEPDLSVYLDTTKIPFLDVNPFGTFDVQLGARNQKLENPTIPIRQRTTGGLDFDMNIQMGITGSIAERLNFDATYNTQSNFNVGRNQFKVGYEGKEDDILQAIDFGNVSLPLSGTLIQGNQSLLGVKTELQFGRLTMTNIISEQESRQQNLVLEGGTQKRDFSLKADEYEVNKHFFLAHYFRDQYEDNLNTLPQLNTPYNITRLEVWVTNRNFQTTNIREFMAFTDLGEETRINNPAVISNPGNGGFADNDANSLYNQLVGAGNTIRQPQSAPTFLSGLGLREIEDFEIITGRKLEPTEFTFNRDLGYISLNRALAPDEVLGVTFEYTDLQGNLHQVGEFSENVSLDDNQEDQLIIIKLLKPKAALTDIPVWDLMMKNIYSLGAFQVNREDFRLDIYYSDPGDGLKRYLPVAAGEPLFEVPLIRGSKLDRFNISNFPTPDGVFDFIEGYTIDTRTGRLIFPVLEPFGDNLRNQLSPGDADEFVYDELYDLTKIQAQQFPEFNRYSVVGSYKSKVTDEISLGAFNIPRGSLQVTGGGRRLIEGVDYTIDYNLGRLKILNSSLIQSGVPLNVRYENNLQFGFDSKRLVGSRLDYFANEKLSLGGTIMNLQERPFSNKVNIGDDPISNSVFGFDLNYQTQSDWLTRVVDKIPLIDTKVESSVNLQAEYARFLPGHAKQIGQGGTGQVYIDDFEGASSNYDLKFPTQAWSISGTPRRFPESELIDDLTYGYNRSKISWYNIDPVLNADNSSGNRPDNIDANARSDVYARQVFEREIFPNRINDRRTNLPQNTFDVSFYPAERGPYNFNVGELNPDGTFQNPETKWGGITRSLNVTDFQAANVEFVEFWLMDPFMNSTSANPGKLVLNLGNISEDVLRDGRKFFENGLPEPGQIPNLDSTSWGVVPKVLNINNAFSANDGALQAQDVGFDGLNNEDEVDYFADYLTQLGAALPGSQALQNALEDPAGDDYRHFLDGSFDAQSAGIVRRYNSFNNPHGNSSGVANNNNSNISLNSTNEPDTEDLNRDNTLERTEAYYEYELDLSQASLQVGSNFIVSKVTANVDLPNGANTDVDWYQFKVPISAYDQAVNNIQGFQSIRFFRMYLTEFQDPVTLRFAELNLQRNQWRRYQFEFDSVPPIPVDPNVSFNVFPVNIEENAQKQPIPYVLPPGIQREEIQGAANSFLRNEQSLAMQACALPDGDGRAIHKILNLDLRNYKELKMFVHAESLISESPVADGEVELFVRVGSDFTENYYEHSVPLKITPGGASDPFTIWPEENNVDIDLIEWVDLKRQRNEAGADPRQPFFNADGNEAVIGTPDLGLASFVMIGVRNPNDDNRSKCIEVWVNELRVSGFNEDPGYAALARADIQLADFGNVSLSGNMHTVGYGAIEQRIDQRLRDDYNQFDISGQFNLDKFLPKKSGIKLPVFASYSQTNSLPQYDPYETDVELKNAPDSIRDAAKDKIEIKTISLSNIRKERTNPEKKARVWDIENFNASFSYTEKNTQTPIVFDEVDKTHFGALAYNFNTQPKYIRPFNGLVKEGKYLQWLKDFNINLVPSNISVRTDMTRRFQETFLRDIQEPTTSLDPFYYKDWLWNRNYDLRWNLTESLSIDFDAANQSRIDEPDGLIDTDQEKDSIRNNLRDFGRNVNYSHNAGATYQLPFKKIPILDWIAADASYGTNYQWLGAPLERDINGDIAVNTLGNIITNSQNMTLSSTFNFSELYNKSGFLKEYNQKRRPQRRERKKKDSQEEEEEFNDPPIPDSPPKEDEKEGEKEKQALSYSPALAAVIKPLLSVKRVTLNYNERKGTTLPGFTPTPKYFGQDLDVEAPGWDFVFGYQPNNQWLENAAANNWITLDPTFNYQFRQDDTKTISGQATLEPFPDLNIDIDMSYNRSDNYSEVFRDTSGGVGPVTFAHVNPYESGSYDISFIAFKTLFGGQNEDGIPSVFRDFEQQRILASQFLGARNNSSTGGFPNNPNFTQGYGPYSQEVLIAAFVSAYTGKDIADVEVNPFDTKPLPNWSLNYNGLTKIPFFAERFSSFRLTHSYKSTFSINQYNSNLNYEGLLDPDGNEVRDYFLPTTFDQLSDNFYSLYYIPQIRITEQFAPLAGLDFATKGGLSMQLKYGKSRTLGMSLVDYQLSENNSTEFTIGAGLQTQNFKVPFKIGGRQRVLENDLIFRVDYSLRDDIVTNYKLDQNTSQPTRGAKTITLFPTIDYVLNDKMNIQLYFDQRRSEPKTRNSYPVINTRSGAKFTYTFGR